MHDELVDSRMFLNSMFPPAPNSALPAPEKQSWRPVRICRAISQEHQASGKKTILPVSQRATNQLIRQLQLTGPREQIGEAEKQSFAMLFQGPLASKFIAVIHVATRLADDEVIRATTRDGNGSGSGRVE
jgi:hypothetical protein